MKREPKNVKEVLDQLSKLKDGGELIVGKQEMNITHLDKPLWKKTKGHRAYTKRELFEYYAQVSPYLLPHLKDRPVTIVRYPHGVDDMFFFQKHLQEGSPKFLPTITMYTGDKDRDLPFIMVDSLAALMYFVQIGVIDFHPWYSRVTNGGPDKSKAPNKATGSEKQIDKSILNYPDFVVFDLDPYIYSGKEKAHEEPERNKKSYEATREIAFELKKLLDKLKLKSFPKTSGKTGIHVYVPVKRDVPYEQTREVAKSVGEYLLNRLPKKITMEWSVKNRRGKVFFDHNQNSRGKTLASVLSVRAYRDATVSMPVTWKQLETVSPLDFTIENVPGILQQKGDPWRDIMKAKTDIRKLHGER